MPEAEYLQFGGLAVPEGVMMRSPKFWAVACRAPNNEIVVKTEPLEKTWIGRQKWLQKPFLRGTFGLLDTMALGNRAMQFAGEVQIDDRYQPGGDQPEPEEELEPKWYERIYDKNPKFWETVLIGTTVVISLALGLFVFDAVPIALAQWINPSEWIAGDENGIVTNYLEQIIKLAMFIGYLALIRRLPAIYEVFRYHGAEHKAINTIEANEELNETNCLARTRLHPRCGTNFAIIVMLVGFLVFPLIPREAYVRPATDLSLLWFTLDNDFWVWLNRFVLALLVLPIFAGISYEVIRAAGKAKDARWVNTLLWPGLMTQYITTAEPNEKHIEVAIASLDAVLRAEETGELTNTFEPPDEEPVLAPGASGIA